MSDLSRCNGSRSLDNSWPGWMRKRSFFIQNGLEEPSYMFVIWGLNQALYSKMGMAVTVPRGMAKRLHL